MGRRSAQNPRYRKDAQVGSTRKSAASAKPKRSAGEASGSSSKKSSTKKKTTASMITPDTPEFKKWRKIWLGLLIAAMVLSLASFAFRETYTLATQVALVLAYSCIFGAFFIDLTIIRKMRKEFLAANEAKGKKKVEKPDATDKADAAAGPSIDGGQDNLGTTTDSQDEGKAD